MRILSFGSMNVDHTYRVGRIVGPGQTVPADAYEKHVGGKGLNQSVALARAGAKVFHAGMIGEEGGMLLDFLRSADVDVTNVVTTTRVPCGHAMIQVDAEGQNSIVCYGGANYAVEPEFIDAVLASFGPGDALVCQNEISNAGYLIEAAHDKGIFVIFNPSPLSAGLTDYPLDKVDLFIMNETEAAFLCGREGFGAEARTELTGRYPDAKFVVTLGGDGAVYFDKNGRSFCPAMSVDPVDTTGAGDTFTGYFVTEYLTGAAPQVALRAASAAAGLAVTRRGAAEAIPMRSEVRDFVAAR